eukprot:CAMPEP_0201607556 /NCGR_PEP_ID=MMETSP0492-20130828/6621_1 /ASSEMBLY_ACC=CAM_ASM_000837 /TAXON_ID=420259 /ORGANISM="Thalassiosira gravida, Strain GMp14c1" /LENGTH=207 /DNA_ID=CAMNT_0048072163 /DNA_START=122 /DNA_END=745 /DNA_ORIENTATION=+
MTEVNTGVQNKSGGNGRSILDYSLVACLTLILLMIILLLDAFEYVSVPGKDHVKAGFNAAKSMGSSIVGGGDETNAELLELQKQIEDAKAILKEKHDEVEKLVEKVEDEIVEEEKKEALASGAPAPKVETVQEKKEEEAKKEAVVKAVVEHELGLDKFCPDCQWKNMPFTCQKRVDWMMGTYSITEEAAKESVIQGCHTRLRRGRVF